MSSDRQPPGMLVDYEHCSPLVSMLVRDAPPELFSVPPFNSVPLKASRRSSSRYAPPLKKSQGFS
jgi:hypothetical protein